MDEAAFWKLIHSTKGSAEKISKALKLVTPDEIKTFSNIYWEKHRSLHHWDLWAALYIMNGGCSDDSFHYGKAWVIGKGEAVYQVALNSPDNLGPHVTDSDLEDGCDNEMLNYAADEAFEALTGRNLDYETGEDEVPAGTAFDEDEAYLAKNFPKLTAQFG
jgi:hypothetical protein